jgi:hypothetical protein
MGSLAARTGRKRRNSPETGPERASGMRNWHMRTPRQFFQGSENSSLSGVLYRSFA